MKRVTLAAAVLFALAGPARAQGLLDKARGRMDGRFPPAGPRSPDPATVNDPRSAWNAGGSGESWAYVAVVAAAGVTAPVWGPRALLEDRVGDAPGLFPGHPYARGKGYQAFEADRDEPAWGDSRRLKPWAVRAGADGGSDFSGLSRVGTDAFLDTSSRFGAHAATDTYLERTQAGGVDTATLFTLDVTYRFAQAERAAVYGGVGPVLWFDDSRTRVGAVARYGVDVFPVRPVVVSGVAEVGAVGEAFYLHLRGTVGVQWRHAELFAGYDFRRVSTANLQGAAVGVRAWF